ncbi:cation channel sperm-associated protein 2-like [Podarcis raffonei]|uniref:cation channel sperm-associated protein 2-like n=1 Tax=Podarcis raffonei TaxID=65483 RepID=UPI00232940D2|nr:cation channel sperm-associated protein 2-like [Podarcis raffonei]
MEDQPPSSHASKETNEVPFELHPRADAIRSKLIYTFYLIDYLRGLGSAIPRHNIRDFLDHRKLKKLMLTDHHQLVRFNVVPKRNVMITREIRCRNRIRVRCSRWPPVAMWAYSVLNSQIFKVFMIFLICLNMVVLMILVEIRDKLEDHFVKMKIAMEVIIWVIVLIFLVEIGLNWAVSFQDYFKNSWNVFDCTVTIISFIPELILLVEKKHSKAVTYFLQVCRVLRCLKLFPRLRQIRILIMALFKAMKAMSFILVLLVFFFYIFAVSGIFFFDGYTRSNLDDLEYNKYFQDMPNSLVTIFILFTMDHWYALLQDTWKVPEINKAISGLFICLWLLIGAFIFRNLMVATMVTNFQTIRNELSEEMKQIETQQKADKFKLELLEKKYSSPQGQDKMSMGPSTIYSIPEVEAGPLDWETYVHKNLPGLYEADNDEQVIWPRDALFRYFELLEKLQYNLDERKQLQNYAVLALSNLEDK